MSMEPDMICPHCGHEWYMHKDMLCFRCNEFHTVCGMCVDLGICFTEVKEDVKWEPEEDEDK